MPIQHVRTCVMVTDFGLHDPFVGVLHGVICSLSPGVRVVDLTHQLPAYNVEAASFVLEQSLPFFPTGSVFLVVVDPGVGSSRRVIVVSDSRHYFVAPDNGVLSYVLKQPQTRAWNVNKKEFFLSETPSTFEARDRMAPIAAWLCLGVDPGAMGPAIRDPMILDAQAAEVISNRVTARVIYIDGFGNIITNLRADRLPEPTAGSRTSALRAVINGHAVERRVSSYSQGGTGEAVLIAGSHGYLEIAMMRQSAAAEFNAALNDPVYFEWHPDSA